MNFAALLKPKKGSVVKYSDNVVVDICVRHAGDVAASICLVFIAMYNFAPFAKIGAKFVSAQHNITDATPTDPVYYISGKQDIMLLFFAVMAAVTIQDALKDLLFDSIAKHFSLPKANQAVFSANLYSVFVFGAFAVTSLQSVVSERYLIDRHLLWEDYPHAMVLGTKVFYIAHIAANLGAALYDVINKIRVPATKTNHVANLITAAIISLGYILNFNRVGIVLLSLYDTQAALGALVGVVQQLSLQPKKAKGKGMNYANMAKTLATVNNVVSLFAATAHVFISALVFSYGLPTVVYTEPEEGDFNTPIIRSFAIVLLLIAGAYPTISHHLLASDVTDSKAE